MRIAIQSRDAQTLGNCLRVAAEAFGEHAKEFRATAKADTVKAGTAFITTSACERLAEQFDRQQAEALCLAGRISSAAEREEWGSEYEPVEVPRGLQLNPGASKYEHCGRPSCTHCYRPGTERDERGGYIVDTFRRGAING